MITLAERFFCLLLVVDIHRRAVPTCDLAGFVARRKSNVTEPVIDADMPTRLMVDMMTIMMVVTPLIMTSSMTMMTTAPTAR